MNILSLANRQDSSINLRPRTSSWWALGILLASNLWLPQSKAQSIQHPPQLQPPLSCLGLLPPENCGPLPAQRGQLVWNRKFNYDNGINGQIYYSKVDNLKEGDNILCSWGDATRVSGVTTTPTWFFRTSDPLTTQLPANWFGWQEEYLNVPSTGYLGVLAHAPVASAYDPVTRPIHQYVYQELRPETVNGAPTGLPHAALPGSTYYAEMHVSLADKVGRAVKNIGMYFMPNAPTPAQFGTDQVFSTEPSLFRPLGYTASTPTSSLPPPLSPQDPYLIQRKASGGASAYLNDKIGWTRVAGCFSVDPAGSELKYLVIGDFAQEDGLNTMLDVTASGTALPGTGGLYDAGDEIVSTYYYIADPRLHEFPTAGDDQASACGQTLLLGSGCDLPPTSLATYAWTYNGQPLVTAATTAFLALGGTSSYPLAAGTYALTVSVPPVDGIGAPTERTTQCNVTIANQPVITAVTSGGTLCAGAPSSATLTVSGGTAPYTWSTGAIGTSVTVTTTQTTTYIVTDANGCSASFTLNFLPSPTVTIQGATTFCPGQTSVLLTASGGGTNAQYLWSTGATTVSIPVAPTATTTYSVTVTASNSCSATAQHTVSVPSPLTLPSGLTIGPGVAGAPVVYTINTNQRIRGTIRVMKYATLIIDGARLEFDDTRTSLQAQGVAVNGNNASRIVVDPQGELQVINRAVLTVLQDACTGAKMWDGIIVTGTPNNLNLVPAGQRIPQGVATLSDCTIEHARVGVLGGRASYGPLSSQVKNYRQISASSLDGGGVITAYNVTFRNCQIGAYLGACKYANRSTFTSCYFSSTAVLADADYSSASNERYGMQIGLQLREARGVTVTSSTFQGWRTTTPTLRGVGVYLNDAGAKIQAAQFKPGTHQALSGPTTFAGLWQGVTTGNLLTGCDLTVWGCTFTDSPGGLLVSGSNGAQVEGNIFQVGSSGYTYGYGLQYINAAMSVPEDNYFTHWAGSSNRGLYINQSSNQPAVTFNSIGLKAYRNKFGSGLTTGIYAQFDNRGFTFRCNTFAPQQIPGNDVEVRTGNIFSLQGICNPNDVAATANNQFSHSGTRPSMTIIQSTTGFNYAYPRNPELIPSYLATTTSQTVGVVAPDPCGYDILITNGVPQGCPASPVHSIIELRALLASNVDSIERPLLVSALVRQLLDADTNGAHLDSAITLLQAENNNFYQAWVNQLQARAGHFSGNVNREVNTRALRSRISSNRGNDARRITTTTDYFERVRELLGPLGNDSVRAMTIANDASLHAELISMAEDSLIWGSNAARTALNMYAGGHYGLWDAAINESNSDSAITNNGHRLIVTQGLILTPNPSDGQVTVAYTSPLNWQMATIVIYDAWGLEVARQCVGSKKNQVDLALSLRGGLYQLVLIADGQMIGRERLLIEPR